MRVVLTPCGQRRLRARLHAFRAEFEAVVADNPAALESGDSSGWHDNFAFEENQRRMHQLAHRVRELERVLERAEIVPPLREAPERVIVGASVRWRYLDDPEEHTRELWLAGFEDGDPAAGRVSYDSPLGHALLGAVEDDVREAVINGRRRQIEVMRIGPTPVDEAASERAVCI